MKISYDVYNRTEPTEVYIAKPGQRIIGKLSGIEEDTAYCEINLNNTNTIEFTMDRDLSGEVNPFYDYVDVHYELYLKNIGWFKINEVPQIDNNGDVETKTVRAESLEIELQQYDLFGFRVNTGSEDSREMLATDNTYPIDDFTMFRDQVKFYRDTTQYAALSEAYKTGGGDLKNYLEDYPDILSSWRIDFDYDTFDNAIDLAIADMQAEGKDTDAIASFKGKVKTKAVATNLCRVYKQLRRYVDLVIDNVDAFDDQVTYTTQEIIDREWARQNELSFLWCVLHEHGWTVGYVDDVGDPQGATAEDRERLPDRIGMFDVDSQDIYSFLTQDAAQYYRCLFTFDTDNYKVNAYKIEHVGEDTNIILSFHNIQNSVTRNSNKQLYTVFNVAGADDLDFTEANFGDTKIEDLSYFMNTDHFSQEMIDKYTAWHDFKEEKRPEYIQLAKNYRNQLEKCTEIYERVPVDNADTAQYSTFSDDELINEKANMQAQLAGYEKLYVNEDGEFDIEIMRTNNPVDYSDYIMIRDQVIPNIDIALYNRGVDSTDDEREYLDNWKYNFAVYGKSYGVAELENQLTMLSNSILSLERKHHDQPAEEGDEYGARQYALYQKYVQARSECQTALTERRGEYDAALDALDDIQAQMKAMTELVAKENAQHGFTEEELNLLDKYYIQTDYENENILVTDYDTNDQIVDTEYELYKDALEQLYAESHPQWSWQTTQDNLLLIPEFQGWHEPLDVGNFVRVTMREESYDDSLQVKLRVTRIGFNPFLLEQTIDIDFSNMVQYKSKRNDFVELLGEGGGSGKNKITASVATSSSRDTVNVDTSLIMKIINNSAFSGYMGDYVGDVTAQAISAVSGSIGSLVAEQIDAIEINVDHITGTKAEFQEVLANYIDANYIVTNMLRANDADFANMTASSAIVENLLTVGTEQITTIAGGAITTERIIAGIADAEELSDFNVLANSAFINYLNSGVINAGTITVETLKATLAQVDTLQADSAFVRYLQGISSTTVTSTINDAYIRNAVVGKISVGDLSAGNIVLSDSMQITSENGNMVMNGSALQIIGEDSNGNPYVGVQLGYDTGGEPSLILRNEDGATILTPTGITQDAVADGLIINNMIHTGTIAKDKLGFQVIEPNAQGGVDITQVYDGSGNLWGVEYVTFQDGTKKALDKFSYKLEIETPNGKNLRGGNITLNAKLYHDGVDVTDQWDASYFIWTRQSLDSYGDQYWNEAHSTGTKSITITGNDVRIEADFSCRFEVNGVSVSS